MRTGRTPPTEDEAAVSWPPPSKADQRQFTTNYALLGSGPLRRASGTSLRQCVPALLEQDRIGDRAALAAGLRRGGSCLGCPRWTATAPGLRGSCGGCLRRTNTPGNQPRRLSTVQTSDREGGQEKRSIASVIGFLWVARSRRSAVGELVADPRSWRRHLPAQRRALLRSWRTSLCRKSQLEPFRLPCDRAPWASSNPRQPLAKGSQWFGVLRSKRLRST